ERMTSQRSHGLSPLWTTPGDNYTDVVLPRFIPSCGSLPAGGVGEADRHEGDADEQVVLLEVVEDRDLVEVLTGEDVVGADPQQADEEAAHHGDHHAAARAAR